MTFCSLTFDAVDEAVPGPKWRVRWDRSWPAYRAWFLANGGETAPSRAECETALEGHMPALLPVWRKLLKLAGGGDLEARFLSTWCPPRYLGGCSLAAIAEGDAVRLVRNYDLSPDLNEGLLLKSAWTGKPVMGMIEFLWGLSDGINADGLAVALAYGGRTEVAPGFGVTTILRYVLETCRDVGEAMAVFERVPSHMAYNIALADRTGATAVIELAPGGGALRVTPAIATNHQHGIEPDGVMLFERSQRRLAHLRHLVDTHAEPASLGDAFLQAPLFQRGYAEGYGTLFTADYDPCKSSLVLRWPGENWVQSLDGFAEGQRVIRYEPTASTQRVPIGHGAQAIAAAITPHLAPGSARRLERWRRRAEKGDVDWISLGHVLAAAYCPGPTRRSCPGAG